VDPVRPISVVVPTRDRPALLDGCLEALRAALRPADEIIIADSMSTDPTVREIASRHGGVYVRCAVPGASHARNRGWNTARHEVVAFIDDDVRVDPGWASALARAFDDPGVTFVSGRTGQGEGSLSPALAQKTDETAHRLDGSTSGVLGHSANLAVRIRALEHIGGFDERLGAGGRFRAAEDLDLFDRLFAAGYVGRYEPTVSAVHLSWRRLRDYVRVQAAYGFGVGARIAKLLRSDRARARRAARSAFIDSGVVALAGAIRHRWRAGIAARVLRLLTTVAGLVAGLVVPVRDGHFGGRTHVG
jgi:glycosyltransferase involved in cell wall biosynthesis